MSLRETLDDTIATWERERPDLDLGAMFTTLRVAQLMNAATKQLEAVLAEHGLNLGEFDVLAALRRHGSGARLTPSVLARVAMVSPGGMTNRLDRLEAAGHIRRAPDPADRRGSQVSLTRSGRAVADRALEAIVAVDHELFSALTPAAHARIDRALDTLIDRLDQRS